MKRLYPEQEKNRKALIRNNKRYAIVDDDDYDYLSKFKWYERTDGYMYTPVIVNGIRKNIALHRMIMNAPDDMVVDHINRKKCDNRKENLRICTQVQNNYNIKLSHTKTSKYMGVRKNKSYNSFEARARGYGFIGSYATEDEAAVAYNLVVIDLRGEFATLNDVDMSIIPKPLKRNPKTSKYKGVNYSIKKEKWRARLSKDGKVYELGYYGDENDAARAYNKKVLELYGDDAVLNDVPPKKERKRKYLSIKIE